jgi:hypothetical protein
MNKLSEKLKVYLPEILQHLKDREASVELIEFMQTLHNAIEEIEDDRDSLARFIEMEGL